MNRTNLLTNFLLLVFISFSSCSNFRPTDDKANRDETEVSNQLPPVKQTAPFVWENANIYFLLTDRFNNGDTSNDVNFGRSKETAFLRGMMGGDIKGITQKIEEGYFDDLGVTALWFTPVVEQNKGVVDEGTGATYGYHGYWAQDWTVLDPNFGTEEDLEVLVETAHAHGIRILLDVVINHTGPVTGLDPVWPNDWVRTGPKCAFTSYTTTVNCTLVENLPDIKTENNSAVGLPKSLLEKWKIEGRLDRELKELDAFFERTGHPRAPRFYIMKWLTDYIRKFGVDGYRVDTAKHTEESVWKELREEVDIAFAEWKETHPDKVLDKNDFYMVGEVYNYNIATGRQFDIGDQNVDYFANGMTSLVNFGFKTDGHHSPESIFSDYSAKLSGPLKGKSIVNYISSHDDGSPLDKERKMPVEAGTKLLLCPGAVQIYYGDETARSLIIENTGGDATLRSFMNWDEIENNTMRNGHAVKNVLSHWQRLGRFRKSHPAVGAGLHEMISETPYFFKRVYQNGEYTDKVIVGLDLAKGKKTIEVNGLFADGKELIDYYSGEKVKVESGRVVIDTDYAIVLLGK